MLLFFYNFSLFLIDFIQIVWNTALFTVQSIFRIFIKPAKVPLDGETALITGAGHGMGREMALEFARRGAKVVLWDINQEGNEATANGVKKEGGKAFTYVCDVSNKDSVKSVAQQVLQDIGEINILVNNAGIMPVQPFTKLNHQQMTRIMEVNVLAQFWTLSEFLPRMIEMGRGHIVAMSSFAGKCGTPNVVPYTASKFAVTGLMDSLTAELRHLKLHPDIFTTTVFPGVINTGLAKNPRLKYPNIFKITEPDEAARQIIDGIQLRKEFVYIPFFYEYFLKILEFLPRKVYFLIFDFLDSCLDPQD